jgi:ATP-dependent RNA helicase RhlE
LGVYGGVNINTQKLAVLEGMDILVATPGRLYDLTLSGALKLKMVKKLVIDEVDVMLDLGFRYQLTNILDLLPEKRQNIMFSATMTDDVEKIIENHFIAPVKISIAMSGTPLENIRQSAIPVLNFNTKLNLLNHLLADKEEFSKVLIFGPGKKLSDRIFEFLKEEFGEEVGIVHSNKSQNYRLKSIAAFAEGRLRLMVTTDVMARGLDIEDVSHVINFDCPAFPENYIHRIGRTGRAEQEGKSLLLFTEKERKFKDAIELLMKMRIDELNFPEEVELNYEMIREEKSESSLRKSARRNERKRVSGGAFHEKKAKNRKTNQGGSYRRKLAAKYKKPKTKGGKNKR